MDSHNSRPEISGQNAAKPLGIYIHFPFCIRKCLYCDFLSFLADESVREKYVRALIREIRAQAPLYGDYHVDTVFLGGGTPSLMTGEQLNRIMEEVYADFHFAPRAAEITMEANPGTLDAGKLHAYQKSGINRLSLGLQSADNGELRALGRIHTWEQFLESWKQARKAGFDNMNIDLMSALPGQTTASWMDTLRRVAALSPEHLSAYSLIIEEGTPFYERYGEQERIREAGGSPESLQGTDGGWPALPSEEEERLMYERTGEYLSGMGYERYEISNYARPGHACRHNSACWRRVDYAGFGLGAASLRQNVRWNNIGGLDQYLKESAAEGLLTPLKTGLQVLSVQEQMEEFMFLGLRMTEGISGKVFRNIFGVSLHQVYGGVLKKLEAEGLMEKTDCTEDRWRLTPAGVDVSNYALARFLF